MLMTVSVCATTTTMKMTMFLEAVTAAAVALGGGKVIQVIKVRLQKNKQTSLTSEIHTDAVIQQTYTVECEWSGMAGANLCE